MALLSCPFCCVSCSLFLCSISTTCLSFSSLLCSCSDSASPLVRFVLIEAVGYVSVTRRSWRRAPCEQFQCDLQFSPLSPAIEQYVRSACLRICNNTFILIACHFSWYLTLFIHLFLSQPIIPTALSAVISLRHFFRLLSYISSACLINIILNVVLCLSPL